LGNRGVHIEAVTPHLFGGRRLCARPVEANSLEGKMDAKPTDTKPMDLDLELAVFAAP
jgi:hypothetical protein